MPVPELTYHHFIIPPSFGAKFSCNMIPARYENFVHAVKNGSQVITCGSRENKSQEYDTGITSEERIVLVQAGWKEVPDGHHPFIGSRPMEEVKPNNIFIRFHHGSESNAILFATLNIQFYQ